MKKKFFILVCETEKGTVYANPCLLEAFELQDCLASHSRAGVKVIDIKTLDLDFSEYEHKKRID